MANKILSVGAAGLVSAAILYSGAAYWSGIKAEETLQEQYRTIASWQLFKVQSRHYERGWFRSHERTELSLNRSVIEPYLSVLPEQAQGLLDARLVFENKIVHGPLPGLTNFDFRPARAWVDTIFQMSDATRNTLSKFFGDAEPITVTNRLYFTGGGELRVSIPRFDYEETLSGVRIHWGGFEGTADYETGYKKYLLNANFPSLQLDAATKGHIEFRNIAYQSDVHTGETGVNLGKSEFAIESIRLDSRENLPYEIRLNELVHLLTRMRVGEFINPSGEIRPSTANLKNLRYQVDTGEEGEFINTRGKLTFDTLSVNGDPVGPLLVDISARHLHGPTLMRLDRALATIPFEGKDPEEVRRQYVDTLIGEGTPLLMRDPELEIHALNLKTSSGEVDVTGKIMLKNLSHADMNSALDFLQKLEAEAKIKLPSRTLESLVVAQARNLFVVDESAEDPPDIGEIDDLARNLYSTQLTEWRERNYLRISEGHILTSLLWKHGRLTIGGQPIVMPWEEGSVKVEEDDFSIADVDISAAE